jgi:hypothetical protein
MSTQLNRRTVYAVTAVAILALAGSWAFAATLVTSNPPAQNSTVTVINPTEAAETVQSAQLISFSGSLDANLSDAGTQVTIGGPLNSTFQNAHLATCATATCSGYYFAVDASSTLPGAHATPAPVANDAGLQLVVLVPQGTTAAGFDVQVEVLFGAQSVFGSGYFDTGTSSFTGGSMVSVFLYVDFGISSVDPVSETNIVVTLNSCTSTTICP